MSLFWQYGGAYVPILVPRISGGAYVPILVARWRLCPYFGTVALMSLFWKKPNGKMWTQEKTGKYYYEMVRVQKPYHNCDKPFLYEPQ